MTSAKKPHQAAWMIRALKEYQDSLISLEALISNIEHSLEIIQDQDLKDSIFDALLALEEIYAHTRIGDFDFEKHGRHVVDRAVREILMKVERYSSDSG